MAVLGLARSGAAAARWLAAQGVRVYASDVADSAALREAARTLTAPGVTVDVGRHDVDRITRAAAVVVSPGIPPRAQALAAARKAGVEVVAELDLAARALRTTRMIVVTGTNGKSTTTALIGQVLTSAGRTTAVAGNIGRPLITVALEGPAPEWAVVEASSFQLHDSPHLDPAVGVVTNLSPDHLDRYASVESYYADKHLLFQNASDRSIWVLNGDDPGVLSLAAGAAGRHRLFRLDTPADAWFDVSIGWLMLGDRPLLARSDLPLLGQHNVANALATALAADSAGVSAEAIASALATARGLPHRMEAVRDVRGILWVNDSKGTNVASTVVALRAVDRPFILIAGGRGKGEAFTPLSPLLRGRCRTVIAYGEARSKLVNDLRGACPVEEQHTFDAAVARAAALAGPGEVVLLSPACASFDQFANYEERGARFRRLVEAL